MTHIHIKPFFDFRGEWVTKIRKIKNKLGGFPKIAFFSQIGSIFSGPRGSTLIKFNFYKSLNLFHNSKCIECSLRMR